MARGQGRRSIFLTGGEAKVRKISIEGIVCDLKGFFSGSMLCQQEYSKVTNELSVGCYTIFVSVILKCQYDFKKKCVFYDNLKVFNII